MKVKTDGTWVGLLYFLSEIVSKETQGKNGGHPDQGCAHPLVQAPKDPLVLDRLGHTIPHARVHGLLSWLGEWNGLKPDLDGVQGVT